MIPREALVGAGLAPPGRQSATLSDTGNATPVAALSERAGLGAAICTADLETRPSPISTLLTIWYNKTKVSHYQQLAL
jgi:hypothetical protein